MSARHTSILGARVILLRMTAAGGFEAFLTRDPDDNSSLGFPGGPVTKEDYSSGMLDRCWGLSPAAARRIVGAHFTPKEASGPWVAAIRSLFMEAGCLLAVNEAGQDPMRDPEWTVRLQNQRDALRTGTSSFASFLAQQGLWADASKLTYFSSWQTSPRGSKLCASHFYLAALVPGLGRLLSARPRAPRGLWLSPERAIFSCVQGELPMDFATFSSLRTVADFDSLQSLFREYGSERWK